MTRCQLQITTQTGLGELVRSQHAIISWQEFEQLLLNNTSWPASFDLCCDTPVFDMVLMLDGHRAHLEITSGELKRPSSPVVYTLCARGKCPSDTQVQMAIGWTTRPEWSAVEGVEQVLEAAQIYFEKQQRG